ncbi:hypothetical protein FR483_n417L [Paramecium bursaria Chlorella virus FR483]|uniref:Uncharacterized protein n417L n=1 Tax=Paramecium bursaria Chlorella virus FR483 TaxID=399781 RepID=A7J7C1_PBCVF|nr:hypothetical protein FR483_n417L [Paramecium bursaria Chlorella virus FR483]ABT15702.1 hypothetical protein FR483_n417L [Paramecium bursaria Chlorella virus FR483]
MDPGNGKTRKGQGSCHCGQICIYQGQLLVAARSSRRCHVLGTQAKGVKRCDAGKVCHSDKSGSGNKGKGRPTKQLRASADEAQDIFPQGTVAD